MFDASVLIFVAECYGMFFFRGNPALHQLPGEFSARPSNLSIVEARQPLGAMRNAWQHLMVQLQPKLTLW